MELSPGKVAVVTGGASGIGLGLARRFGQAGLRVVIADVQPDALDAAANQLGNEGIDVLAVPTDVSDRASVEALRDATLTRFGAVHVVCNNAGVGGVGDAWHGPIEAWEWVVGVNLMGVVYGIHAFLPALEAQGEGHIVNTASMAGVTAGVLGPYSATKHAVVALSESLYFSQRMNGTNIGVSCLCPGWVRTNIASSERNWPQRYGQAPERPPAAEAMHALVEQALAEGMPPAQLADRVAVAIAANRFWIFPHPEMLDAVVRRAHGMVDGANPELPGFATNDQ